MQVKNRSSRMSEEDEEFKEIIKNLRRKLEVPAAPAMPCKIVHCRKNGAIRSGKDDHWSKLMCILEANESKRLRMKEKVPGAQETTLLEKGLILCNIANWYTNLFLCLKH